VFVGHALLAFGLVALLVGRRWPRERALRAGLVAALFATVPDVDVVYALVGVAGSLDGGSAVEGFWAASTVTHRGATHALPVGVVAAAAFAGWPDRRLAGPLLAGLGALALLLVGPLAGLVVGLFAVAGLAVGGVAGRWFEARTAAALAAAGLLTHPFGDLLTGEPPGLLFPFDVTVVAGRVEPFADPTLNLLAAFGVELGALWVGVWALGRLAGWRPRETVHPRAVAGVGYAGAVLLVPSPTVDAAYQFVFGVLAVGAVTAGPTPWLDRWGSEWTTLYGAVMTALAAVTLAGGAYAAAYLLTG
jgi:membrane-bound metal-dependent hydrolase YbcI (DUF457 family)